MEGKKIPFDKYKHVIAVDSIIFGFENKELSLLLRKRDEAPFVDTWSLIGGLVDEAESIDHSVYRILGDYTGLVDIYLEQIRAFGDLERDPEGRTVSIAYFALIQKKKFDDSQVDKFEAKWFPVDKLPSLAFDHGEMIKAARNQMKIQSILHPIGFKLLPKRFTIPDLQALYESIFDRQLDPRNFRRRILSLDILKKLDLKDKKGSKKGAFLYEFDKPNYKKVVEETKNLSNVFRLF